VKGTEARINFEENSDFSRKAMLLTRSEVDIKTLLRDLAEEWLQTTDCRCCAFLFADGNSQALTIAASSGLPWSYASNYKRHIGVGEMAEVFWLGKAKIVNHPRAETEIWADLALDGDKQSLMAVGIENRGRSLGVFYSDFHESEVIDDSVVALANFVADLAGMLRTYEQFRSDLERLFAYQKDSMVLPFEVFLQKFKQQLEDQLRADSRLNLAILDLDEIPDLDGKHKASRYAELQRELGEFIGKQMRSGDLLGQYGADEFIITLPRANEADSRTYLTRLQERINTAEFTREKIKLSVSIGSVMAPMHGRSVNDLLHFGRHALYTAKRNGAQQIYIPSRFEFK
jgi:diguanylate cyclase (GGDEF)-like protein